MDYPANIDYDFMTKVIIVGDSGVGKTCMLVRFCENTFTPNYIMTIGIDFKFRTITVDGQRVKLQIWDTAGQERFRTITETFYKGAGGIILAYSSDDRKSFDNVEGWIHQITEKADPNLCRVLVATKSDVDKKAVDPKEGQELASRYGIMFFETSAKSNLGIDDCFSQLAKEIIKTREEQDNYKSEAARGNGPMGLSAMRATEQKKSQSGCCQTI
eukprot:TRINITY_DN120_c0_g1_i4.p1 TRINITY_DN120_c0_g1~~TRINITY_DN120_c0_g1_i4.p1  ORF type:complete len:215 (+),score=38.10 TRINITY_DN120_c0_g1_i4:302-946(+)